MAFAHYLLAVPVDTSSHTKTSIINSSFSSSATESVLSLACTSSSLQFKARNLSIFNRIRRIGHKAKAQPQESELSLAADAFTHFKHLLLPITDRNPYLSEGTRQAAATATALAKKYGADITVVVIDEKEKESLPEHDTQMSSIRWHLSEGGFQEFRLLERLGEGNKPTAIIGEGLYSSFEQAVCDEVNDFTLREIKAFAAVGAFYRSENFVPPDVLDAQKSLLLIQGS